MRNVQDYKTIHLQTLPENYEGLKQKILGLINFVYHHKIKFFLQPSFDEFYIPNEL
jgi:hypothetical protein